MFSISKKIKTTYKNKKVKYINTDVCNIRLLKKKLKNLSFEYIVNLSGYIDHSPLDQKGLETYYQHIYSLLNIVKVIPKKKLEKFIQIGSSAEYGLKYSNQETTRENPLTFYSAGKTAATHLSEMLFQSEKIPITVLRFFQVYGPRQKNDRLIPYVIKNCLKNKSFKLTKCKQIRDFCYIDDIVDAIILTLKSKKTSGNVYNVGSGKGVKLNKLIKKIQRMIGRGKPKIGGIPYQKIENMRLVGNINKFKKHLKWRPKVGLEHGLKLTIKSFSEKR